MQDTKAERLRELSFGAPPQITQPKEIAIPLWPHQVSAAEYATLAPRLILSDHSGTGKDYCGIAALVATARRPLLVTAPPAFLSLWAEHIRRALPARRIVAFEKTTDISPTALRGPDVVLVRHRQFSRAAHVLADIGFRGLLFDQCQRLAVHWTQLAAAARLVAAGMASDSTIVASSSRACATPRSCAGVLEVLGLLDRNPRIAAVREKRTWGDVPDAAELVNGLRGECFLRRSAEAVLALKDGHGTRAFVA